MRRRRVLTALLAWLTAIALMGAAAAEAPEAVVTALTAGDADVLVTDARGVIVGVGRIVAGASFELRLLQDFVGPARLTLLRPDGRTDALEVVVGEGVLVDGFDLLALLTERIVAFTLEVGGVTYHEAERRGADAGPTVGDAPGRGPASPQVPPEAPGQAGTPGAPEDPGAPDDPGARDDPGGPDSPGPRAPEGRP
jgi:hypothetical protein